jgi:hypothetical protein
LFTLEAIILGVGFVLLAAEPAPLYFTLRKSDDKRTSV